jgi:uncharacterized protein
MSKAPEIRRVDKLMSDAGIEEMMTRAYSGRLGTVSADGWPYVCPLIFVWLGGEVWVHNTSAIGHLRSNVEHQSKVCFEVDEPGEVFPYGRFECDTSIAYRSVVAFGHIRIVNDQAQKAAFFDALMKKYSSQELGRPKGFYPRLEQVTVYAIGIERLTGKETVLPAIEGRWPSVDNTKSPHAKP